MSRSEICTAIVEAPEATLNLLREVISLNVALHREIPMEKFKFIKSIGEGTEATVWKAEWSGQTIAVKRFRGIPNRSDFMRELSIMRYSSSYFFSLSRPYNHFLSLLQRPNVLRCFGGCTVNEEKCAIVTEVMDCDLETLLLHREVLPYFLLNPTGLSLSFFHG